MKKDVAVSVKDVGMRFNLNQERVDNLKEYVIKFIKEQLEQDIDLMAEGKNISLLAKWLPSVNASNKATKYNARKIAKALEIVCNDSNSRITV
mgnify:CR=1 FL=1